LLYASAIPIYKQQQQQWLCGTATTINARGTSNNSNIDQEPNQTEAAEEEDSR